MCKLWRCFDIRNLKRGHKLIGTQKRNGHSETFEKRHSYDVKKGKNNNSSDTRNTSTIDKLLVSVGIIDPVKNKFHENYQKMKPIIIDLSKIECQWKIVAKALLLKKMTQNAHALKVLHLQIEMDLRGRIIIMLEATIVALLILV